MPQITHLGRLVLAVLLAAVITLDVVLLDSFSLSIALLAGLLCAVLIVGSSSPFAESKAFPASLLVTQAITVVFLANQQNYVLAVILAISTIGTIRLVWESVS